MGLPGLCRGCSYQKEILGIRLSPKSGDVRGLEMVAYVVAQGSETSPCPGHSPLSPVILEEALPAELVLEKGTVLVKAPLDPGDATSFAHPQLSAYQPDEALIVGHQNHTALKDSKPGGIQGDPKGHEACG